MKTKTNRIVSILLILCMMCGIFAAAPVTVNAAGEFYEMGGVNYNNLNTLLGYVPNGGATPTIITLRANSDPPALCTINNKNIIFNLNGYNLTFEEGLKVIGGSTVDYTGTGSFKANRTVYTGDIMQSTGVVVDGGSFCRLTRVNSDKGVGAWVDNASNLTVNGDVTAIEALGVYSDHASTVTVNGNITAADGAEVYNSSSITVTGNITAEPLYGNGVRAYGNSTVTVTGNITSAYYGAFAYGNVIIKVTGNITVDGWSAEGVTADTGSTIIVTGNITVNSDASSRYGVRAVASSNVIVNGTITAPRYIGVDPAYNSWKTQAQYEAVTTKPGYFTYHNNTSNAWVWDAALTPVCTIVETGVWYIALDDALADVPAATPRTIRLLTNITQPAICNINNKQITFDLNGYDLIFAEGLVVDNGSIIDYTGSTKFQVNRATDGDALTVDNGSTCRLTGAAATDNGIAVLANNNSTITVDGATTVNGIGAGAFAYYGSTVTVYGNIALGVSGYGAAAYFGSTVIVVGNITVAGDGFGVAVNNNSAATVNGDITVAGDGYGAAANDNSAIFVMGDITIAGNGAGAFAINTSEILIDGIITVSDPAQYVSVDGVDKTKAQATSPTTVADFATYTEDGTSSVWVRADALTGTATIDKMSPRIGDVLTGSLVSGNNSGTLSYTWKAGTSTLGTGSTYTVTTADLGSQITLEITSNVETGTRTSSPTAAVLKKTAAAPGAPTLASKTYDSVTLTPHTGYEYSMDGTNWQVSNVFGALSPTTAYTFYQRAAETTDTYASAASPALNETTDAVPAGALTGTADIDNMNPRIGDVLTGSLVGGNNTGTLTYTWKANGITVGTGSTYTVTAADLGEQITVEITSSVETGSVISLPTAAVLKKLAATPGAPTLASKTYNSVTLTAHAGYEYSMDGTNWQVSNVFGGLNPNTPYTFYQRAAETADTYASAASPALNETTDAVPIGALIGTAVINNMNPRIGDVLTGSLTGGNNTGTLTYTWKANGITVGTGSTYTVTAADLGEQITLEITSSVETGSVISLPTAAVLKKLAATPGAPTLASKTHNSVTLTAHAGYEYSMDGTNWQTSNVFGGLNPTTAYTFYQRAAETSDTYASAASPALTETTDAVPAGALTGTADIDNMNPRIGDVLTGSLVGGNNTGTLSYTWKANGITVGTGATYTVTAADLGEQITVEITSSVETGSVISLPTAAVLKKAAPAAPDAPTLASKTHNSVTLTAHAGYEYSMDGTNWQSSNVFGGLNPNTPYTFYQRVAETADTYASAASSSALTETTDAVPAGALTGTAVIDNMNPKVGDVLTGSLTGGNNTGTLSYTWKANGVTVGTGATYTVTAADLGKQITLEITSSMETGTVISAVTAAVLNKVIVTYTITAKAGMGGTVSCGGAYASGETVTLTATPNSNYSFDGWYENGVKILGAGTVYTFTVSADRTLEARFIYTPDVNNTVKPAAPIYTPIVIGYSITQPTISEKAIEYDKNKDGDIVIRLSLGNSVNGAAYILHGLKNNSKQLVKGTDYTFEGNEITIKASYLKKLKSGEQTISFLTNSSVNPKLTLKIIDTTP